MEHEYITYFSQHAFVHSPILQKYGKVSDSKISDKFTMYFVMITFEIHLIYKIISLVRLQNRAWMHPMTQIKLKL